MKLERGLLARALALAELDLYSVASFYVNVNDAARMGLPRV